MRGRFALIAVLLVGLAAPAEAALLRVMTYNIHHGVGNDNALNLNRIASVILAANADIVSLQEVDHGVPRSGNVQQVNRLAELTGMVGYFGKTRNLDGGAYGNGVLVKPGIHVVSTVNRALPNPDNVEARAILELNLSIDSNPATTEFKFFATHLAHNSSAGRIESVSYINNLASTSSVPSILAGDFNFRPDSVAYNSLMNQWTDVTNIANSGKNRDNQIDYIVTRSAAQWNVVTRSQFIVNSTTNVASDHHPLLAVLELGPPAPAALVWNVSGAASFTDGFAASNGSGGVGTFPVSPWDNPGAQELLVGYGGAATVSGNVNRVIGAMRIGTNQASSLIADRNGAGTVTASGGISLTLASGTDSTGDLVIGEGGHAGTLNWNGSGTLDAQGKLRIGQGSVGALNQNGGVVIAGNTSGALKYIGIGSGSGGDGAYNLKNGTFRPGGGIPGNEDRQVIVGDVGAVGMLNVGDGFGSANTALVETDDDIILGRGGGAGGMTIAADGKLLMAGNFAALIIGADEGSVGMVVQNGGSASVDGDVQIGTSLGATGSYVISGGSLTTAADGSGALHIGRAGGNGKLRVEGTASFEHKTEAFIGNLTNSGAVGRLEIAGSTASVKFGQLENAAGGDAGVSETIRWEAAATGLSPLVITGTGLLFSNRVQLQDPAELAANTGAGATLAGDGIALELNLAAFTGNGTLTLIDNQTPDAITGFFERGETRDLYEEGAAILGTGYNGSVSISYVGGTGNDVVLNLVANAVHNADFNGDGVVDGNDFLAWQRGNGTATGATLQQGDANGDGAVNAADLQLWKEQFGQPAVPPQTAAPIPEPTSAALVTFAALATARLRRIAAQR